MLRPLVGFPGDLHVGLSLLELLRVRAFEIFFQLQLGELEVELGLGDVAAGLAFGVGQVHFGGDQRALGVVDDLLLVDHLFHEGRGIEDDQFAVGVVAIPLHNSTCAPYAILAAQRREFGRVIRLLRMVSKSHAIRVRAMAWRSSANAVAGPGATSGPWPSAARQSSIAA